MQGKGLDHATVLATSGGRAGWGGGLGFEGWCVCVCVYLGAGGVGWPNHGAALFFKTHLGCVCLQVVCTLVWWGNSLCLCLCPLFFSLIHTRHQADAVFLAYKWAQMHTILALHHFPLVLFFVHFFASISAAWGSRFSLFPRHLRLHAPIDFPKCVDQVRAEVSHALWAILIELKKAQLFYSCVRFFQM